MSWSSGVKIFCLCCALFLTACLFSSAGEPGDSPTAVTLERVFHVDPGGERLGNGSAAHPWQNLQSALTRLKPGDRLILHPGVYRGPFEIAENYSSGNDDAPIEIRALEGAVLKSSTDQKRRKKPVIFVRRSGWHFFNLEIDASDGLSAVWILGESDKNIVSNIVFERCHFHSGHSSGIVIAPFSESITVRDCHIHDFIHPEKNRDAHGIYIHPGTKNLQIIGNHIHGNSGDSIQVVGPEQSVKQGKKFLPPANEIKITGNTLHEDRENAVDIKTARDVLVKGNQMRGYRPVTTSHGEAVIIHYGAENIRVEENEISDSAQGIAVARGKLDKKPAPIRPRDIFLTQNMLKGTRGISRVGILIDDAENVILRENQIEGFELEVVENKK